MDGRMDMSALERSRLLGSLACGSFGPLGPISYSGGDSSLGQLVPASASELARATSPSALQQYAGRFLSPSGLHPSGASYAMMAGYLANGSHVPESLKHIIPEMQQYWSAAAAHSEGYARYLLGSMYYPYLPYLPATESLALFAQNSASVAHMETALQAHAAQHRIYELQKETFFGPGSYPPGFYSSNPFYGPGLQHEATNLSLPSSSKSKQGEKIKDTDSNENESKRVPDLLIDSKDHVEHKNSKENEPDLKYHEGSERTRGRSSKTDDRDKIKSSTKTIRSPVNDITKHRHESSHISPSIAKETNKLLVSKPLECEVYDLSPRRSTLHSPTRHQRVTSPKCRGIKTISPDTTKGGLSPNKARHNHREVEQDMPENLCLKDRKKDSGTRRKPIESNNCGSLAEVFQTRSVVTSAPINDTSAPANVTSASINVTSAVTLVISDCANSVVSPRNNIDSTSHLSPQTSPKQLSSNTVTTYSLPYYHNLYSHSHPPGSKCIQTTANVPEVGTVSSSVVAVSSLLDLHDSVQNSCEHNKAQMDQCDLCNKSVQNKLHSDIKESEKDKAVAWLTQADIYYSDEKRHLNDSATRNSHECVHKEGDLKGNGLDRHYKKKNVTVVKELEVNSRKHCQVSNEIEDVSVINAASVSHSDTGNSSKIEIELAHDLSLGKQRVNENKRLFVDVKPPQTKECDLNHNSTEQNRVTCKGHEAQLGSCVDLSEDVTENIQNDNQLEEKNDTEIQIETIKQINAIKPMTSTKDLPELVRKADKKEKHDSHESDIAPTAKGKQSTKQSYSQISNTGIPVGIAVARQRNIAPKIPGVEKDVKKQSDETKNKSHIADVKPIRPLKIIRPSTNVGNSLQNDKRNELPANLFVTGGTQPPSMFWPNDASSRQLALQILQSTHPVPSAPWYGHTSFQFSSSGVPTTSSGNNANPVPLTTSAGFKLAQDSITGQIILLPQGADVFGGLTLGNGMGHTSSFGTAMLPGPAGSMSLSTAQTLYSGQQSSTSRPPGLDRNTHFQDFFNSNSLSGIEKAFNEDKNALTPEENAPVMLNTGQTSIPALLSLDSGSMKGPTVSASQSKFGPGQTCPYSFQSQTVPMTLGSGLVTSHIQEQIPDIIQYKHEQASSVQSRGTSPMLPASDSCTEDIDESQLSDTKPEEIFVNVEENENSTIMDNIVDITNLQPDIKELTVNEFERNNVSNAKLENHENNVHANFTQVEEHNLQEVNCMSLIKQNTCLDNDTTVNTVLVECNVCNSPKADRNIFKDLREYDPFKDPRLLEAKEGLELLSTLAERSAHALCMDDIDKCFSKQPYKFSVETSCPVSTSENTNVDHTVDMQCIEETDKVKVCKQTSNKIQNEDIVINTGSRECTTKGDFLKPRIKCGRMFKPKTKHEKYVSLEKKTTTFCGIVIPEDDDVIDSIEIEMKLRLAELQKRYKEKQRQLAKLIPKKPKEIETESQDAEKSKESQDSARGPGRPKKRSLHTNISTDSVSDKGTNIKKTDHQNMGRGKQSQSNIACNGHGLKKKSQSNAASNGHGPIKKKNCAEMLVDRVFRKAGNSFKIPLSKKVNLIAPARIEFPGTSATQDRGETAHRNKSLDFGKLIKRSRLSQIEGKESGFIGGHWHKKYSHDNKHRLFHGDVKLKKQNRENASNVSPENGLGLLAEYATRTDDEIQKRKRKCNETGVISLNPDSPNKKRKPGRPKKCDVVCPGVTETIVAKQSKHIDLFHWQTEEPKKERKISLEGKTPLKPLYLDEWNVRRSERIFLSDPSPQTSPNALSPGIKNKPDTSMKESDDMNKFEKQKKLQTVQFSQKVKRKYSMTYSSQQKSREKTTELLKASRDRLAKMRLDLTKKMNSSSPVNTDSDSEDIPLSSLRQRPVAQVSEPCTIEKNELEDGMKILVFMDGLFHEGELKAIRPPDIYGAILENDRKTRPHYYSQEEILKDAIKDTKPLCTGQLREGTRICAYWSQQFSCLYPGTISRGSPNPNVDKSLISVEFDDGDTGRIPIDHIRIIPQDFPHVDYDPNPLLLLTKRRRTLSTSESSDSRKLISSDISKDQKGKCGPGRQHKIEQQQSKDSVGDEDIFFEKLNETKCKHKTENKQVDDNESINTTPEHASRQPARELWTWSGRSTKRPGLKGKAKKEYFKTVVRGKETLSVGECAVFLSTGRPNLPYVGRIESFWEGWSGQMVVKVKWFYHPEETKGGRRLQNMKGALFRSDHEDENDVLTISHKCDVLPYSEYRRRVDVISHEDNADIYYLAGSYDPAIGHIKFEPGVL